MARRLIIIGPQGSGKGTQGEMLEQELGIAHLSVGECLRQEASAGGALGKRIKAFMEKGELVPEDITEQLIGKLMRESRKGFILDGFPRTTHQADFLDKTTEIDHVIWLDITDERAIARLAGRLVCAKGHNYHKITRPPKKAGICDQCGLPLRARADDTKAAIQRRLETYHRDTAPLLTRYKGRVIKVDASQTIAKVHQDILKGLRK